MSLQTTFTKSGKKINKKKINKKKNRKNQINKTLKSKFVYEVCFVYDESRFTGSSKLH